MPLNKNQKYIWLNTLPHPPLTPPPISYSSLLLYASTHSLRSLILPLLPSLRSPYSSRRRHHHHRFVMSPTTKHRHHQTERDTFSTKCRRHQTETDTFSIKRRRPQTETATFSTVVPKTRFSVSPTLSPSADLSFDSNFESIGADLCRNCLVVPNSVSPTPSPPPTLPPSADHSLDSNFESISADLCPNCSVVPDSVMHFHCLSLILIWQVWDIKKN